MEDKIIENCVDPETWSLNDAAELYGVDRWGHGYFGVSEKGDIDILTSFSGNEIRVSLPDIIAGMQDRGLEMPALLRIENILDDRIRRLNTSFAKAIEQTGYKNHYRGVFPIKVNQQGPVVEEIARFGQRYQHGLEAGSKAELIIALATLTEDAGYIICNGYKDEEFIDLGLHAVQLGIKCFFVIETPSELPIIIRRSQALGVQPLLGVRLKLSEKVDGYWNKDSGDRSLFGLTATQLINVVDELKKAEMLDCLQLIHFHLGSQIPNISNIRRGVREACRYYVDLVGEGAPMGHLDLGGGLAIDYDGSRESSTHSKNYRLSEYCVDIVEAIMNTLDPLDIPHPIIISESGRATVAHSSMLLFNILNVCHFEPAPMPAQLPEECDVQIRNLHHILSVIEARNVQECFNDAHFYRDEIRGLFRRGQVNLRHRALAENIFLEILKRIAQLIPTLERTPTELEGIEESLADIYYGNFSVFQSLPDTWAIEQVFPVMPVHRLNEKPTRNAVIADLTCDCDGKIDHFIGGRETLPLHPLKADEDYYIGVFLVGAYQETLGDLHNLFGDTNVVSVRIDEDGSFDFVREMEGDTIADVLSYVEYQPKMMFENFRRTAENAVKRGRISVAERQKMLDAFSASLRGYTYYET